MATAIEKCIVALFITVAGSGAAVTACSDEPKEFAGSKGQGSYSQDVWGIQVTLKDPSGEVVYSGYGVDSNPTARQRIKYFTLTGETGRGNIASESERGQLTREYKCTTNDGATAVAAVELDRGSLEVTGADGTVIIKDDAIGYTIAKKAAKDFCFGEASPNPPA